MILIKNCRCTICDKVSHHAYEYRDDVLCETCIRFIFPDLIFDDEVYVELKDIGEEEDDSEQHSDPKKCVQEPLRCVSGGF